MSWIYPGLLLVPVRALQEAVDRRFASERNALPMVYVVGWSAVASSVIGHRPCFSVMLLVHGAAFACSRVARPSLAERTIRCHESFHIVPGCCVCISGWLWFAFPFNPELIFSLVVIVAGTVVCSINRRQEHDYLPLAQSDSELSSCSYSDKLIAATVAVATLVEYMSLIGLVVKGGAPLIDVVMYRYGCGAIGITTFGRMFAGYRFAGLEVFHADYTFTNYVVFINKTLLDLPVLFLMCSSFVIAPNPGYTLLLGSLYLPLEHVMSIARDEDYRLEWLFVCIYLEVIGGLFLLILGRHVGEAFNTTTLTIL